MMPLGGHPVRHCIGLGLSNAGDGEVNGECGCRLPHHPNRPNSNHTGDRNVVCRVVCVCSNPGRYTRFVRGGGVGLTCRSAGEQHSSIATSLHRKLNERTHLCVIQQARIDPRVAITNSVEVSEVFHLHTNAIHNVECDIRTL